MSNKYFFPQRIAVFSVPSLFPSGFDYTTRENANCSRSDARILQEALRGTSKRY